MNKKLIKVTKFLLITNNKLKYLFYQFILLLKSF